MENSKRTAAKSRVVWITLILVVSLLAAIALWNSTRSASSMSAAATSDAAQFKNAPVGSKIKVVIEVTEFAADGTLRGTLLQKKSEENYARTAVKVTVHVADHSVFVMGARDDLRTNAILHITGILRSDRTADAEQFVILTNYVHVE